MGKPDAPEPPDPQVTAGAQTAQNIGTAIANNTMGNVNQRTPFGDLTYSQSGSQQWRDPNTGEMYDIPQYTATQTLSPAQQAMLDANNRAGVNLGNLAADQSSRLNDLLSDPMDLSGLPARQGYDQNREPSLDRFGSGPVDPMTGLAAWGEGGPSMQTGIANSGDILNNVDTQTDFTTSVGRGPIQTGVSATGAQSGTIDDAGQIRSDIAASGPVQGSVDIPQIGNLPQITAGRGAGINYQRSDLGDVQSGFGETPSLNLNPNAPGYAQTGAAPQINFNPSQIAGQIRTNANLPGIRDFGGAPQLNFQQGQVGDIQTGFGDAGQVQGDANLGGIRQISNTPQLNFQQSQLGGIQSSLGDAGQIAQMGQGQRAATSFGDVGDIQTQANAPGIRDVTGAGGVQYNRSDLGGAGSIGGVGDIARSFDTGPGAQFEMGDAGAITRSYGTDFSQDRQRVEDALMQRMNPQLDRDRQALEARLASQGIRIGSEAYQDAMSDFSRQSNDARLGAILGAGQEQSRLADLEARRAGFENAAQQQQFQQLAQRQGAFNDAQAQTFGQNATAAQFGNAAQAQEFGQAQARAQFDASEAGRLANQTLQQDAMDLQAQTANADIQNRNQSLQLQRDVAANAAGMDAARFGNEAQQQQYGQARDRFDAFNEGVGQNFSQDLARTQQNNDAQSQLFDQLLGRGQFANNAQAQGADQAIAQDAQQLQAQQAQAELSRQFQALGLDRDVAAGNQALQGAQFANEAQAQRFGQAQARGQFANDAQAQGAGQTLARDDQQLRAGQAQADLEAMFARLGLDRDVAAGSQALQGAQFANDAQAQQAQQQIAQDAQRLTAAGQNADLQANNNRLGLDRDIAANRTALDSFAAGNDARQAAFDQARARGEFANDAQAQLAQQLLAQDQLDVNAQEASGRLGLQAQANSIDAQSRNADMALRAQLANQGAALDSARFANNAQAQQFGQNLTAAQFANQAQGQQYDQNRDRAGFENDAATQELLNQLSAGQFGNAAQAQDFAQGVTNAGLQNDAQMNEFQQLLAAGQFGNQSQAQQFGQNLAQAGFGNDALQQMFQNANTTTAANNAVKQQEFGNYLSGRDQVNQDRAAALQEQFAMRNQPVNEIAALLGGSQVQQPNFVNTGGAQMPTTDVAGIINSNFGQQMQNYQQQTGMWNNIWGGIGGLGAAAIMGSDRRLKTDIVKVRDGILPVYEYRYLWDRPGTVRRGYMAQEVLRVVPQAVLSIGGWLALDYSKLPEVA